MSCCHHHKRQHANLPADAAQLQSVCCHQKLTAADFLALAPTPAAAAPVADWLVLPLAPLSPGAVLPGSPCLLSWRTHSLPPPTDLVVTLQHLVI
jgi:hypothetical protein